LDAPDLFEPVVGYRAWRLDDDGELLPWTGVSGPWTPGVNEAECHYYSRGRAAPDHRPPAPDCMCGIYALANLGDHRLTGRAGQAVGAIVAWGAIELHRTGFRAEKASIVALAEPADESMAEAMARAAHRYGVALVPRADLPVHARQFGAPVSAELLTGDERVSPELAARHVGERGIAIDEHVWASPTATDVKVGITEPFARLLGDDLALTLPPEGTRVDAGDPLAMLHTDGQTLVVWARVSGSIAQRNEAAVWDPRMVALRPETTGWLARIADTGWARDEANFSWGSRGEVFYASRVAEAREGEDVYADLRTSRLFADPLLSVKHGVVRELERLRSAPEFTSEQDVYAACAEPLREHIAARPSVAARVASLDLTVRYEITEPQATMTLHPVGGLARLTCGPCEFDPDLTVTMSASVAKRFFDGRLDVAGGLRCGDLRSSEPPVATLRTFSLLKELFGRAN
jgi:glycine cleavage system H lipoate-binding protein